jgi:hypothetical protein
MPDAHRDDARPALPRRTGRPPLTPKGKRTKDWRPGGDHSDPRDKFALPPGEARKRWKKKNLGPKTPSRAK